MKTFVTGASVGITPGAALVAQEYATIRIKDLDFVCLFVQNKKMPMEQVSTYLLQPIHLLLSAFKHQQVLSHGIPI